jgi:hypothetical protein
MTAVTADADLGAGTRQAFRTPGIYHERMSESASRGWIFRGTYGPPANELPSALATPEVVWHGEGIAFAVPAMHVYTTGAEVFIFCRTTERQPRDIPHARDISTALERGLKINGTAPHPKHGSHEDYGFTFRSWNAFRADEAGNDLIFTLDWPGVTPAERRVPWEEIATALSHVTTLWPR